MSTTLKVSYPFSLQQRVSPHGTAANSISYVYPHLSSCNWSERASDGKGYILSPPYLSLPWKTSVEVHVASSKHSHSIDETTVPYHRIAFLPSPPVFQSLINSPKNPPTVDPQQRILNRPQTPPLRRYKTSQDSHPSMLQVAAPPSEHVRQAHFQPRQQSSHPPFTLSVTKPSSSDGPPEQHKYGSAHIPALAALASLAASAPAAEVKREHTR